MNLRELPMPDPMVGHTGMHGAGNRVAPETARMPGGWLASYPLFNAALHHGETAFRVAPEQVRRAILQRVPRRDTAPDEITARLKDLGVSFVELCTRTVDEAVQAFLASEGGNASSVPRLDELAAQIPHTVTPLVARPPCLLRPGLGIFLDGWMRFFSYRARGDTTIPLVAVDWPALYEQLK